MFRFLVLTAKNILLKFLGRLAKSVLVLSTLTFWGKLFFLKVYFFSLWDFECKFYGLWQNKLSAVIPTFPTCPLEIFRKKCSFRIFRSFFYRSNTLREVFQVFCWKKAGRVVKTACYRWRTSFWEKKWNFHKDLVFVYLQRKHLPKILWRTCPTCICLVHKNTLKKFFLRSFFFLSGTLSVTFLPSGKTNSARLSKVHLTCPENPFSRWKSLEMHKCVFSLT